MATVAGAAPSFDPRQVTAPFNLGGGLDGRYIDKAGRAYDGTGYIVVNIDGAFHRGNPAFTRAGRSVIEAEACFGRMSGTPFLSLCNTSNFVSTDANPDGRAVGGYYFSSLFSSSEPSNSPLNACRVIDSTGAELRCHDFHGTMTSGLIVGQPTARWEGTQQLIYSGVAPGAGVINLKVGGGTDASIGWPIDSVVDALWYVKNGLLANTTLGPRIVAVNLSVSGGAATSSDCRAGTPGDRINRLAGELKAAGVAVVMSAGNSARNTLESWNCGSNIIAVGATEVTAPTQPTAYSNLSKAVRLFAPVGDGSVAPETGNYILTTWGDLGSIRVMGTSFASPQIAGAIAVLRQKHGKAPSVDSIVKALLTSGTPVSGPRAPYAAQDAVVVNIRQALNAPL